MSPDLCLVIRLFVCNCFELICLDHRSAQPNHSMRPRRALVLRFRAAKRKDPLSHVDGTWVQDYRSAHLFLNTHTKMCAPHLDNRLGT